MEIFCKYCSLLNNYIYEILQINRYDQEMHNNDDTLSAILNVNKNRNREENQDLLGQACSVKSRNLAHKINPTHDIEPVALVWTNKLKTLDARHRLLAEKEVNDVLFKFELENKYILESSANVTNSS